MKLPPPEPGLVLSYAYLWWREAKQGREEGVKDRPAVIVLTFKDQQGVTKVATVPLTTALPDDGAKVLEVPREVKTALKLDDRRAWVVVDEVNRFDWPGHDIRPAFGGEGWIYGRMPPRFFNRIRDAVVAAARSGELRVTNRD